jgi:4-hydroxybenzoate polyprenyltransferase
MIKRIFVYLNEMFPITAFIGTMMSALAVQFTYLRLSGIHPDLSLSYLIPGFVLTCISLLIRIMDEFKDYQDDLINFPGRPLPSGRVEKGDLAYLAGFCVLVVLFLSSSAVSVFIWAVVTLLFTGLMFKWFFIESIMRKNLPLAFISHHPIVVFNFIYLIIYCISLHPGVTWDHWSTILPICLIYTNWELMRKIRSPKEETTYTTYSKIFGPRVAIFIALVLQAIIAFSMSNIFSQIESPLVLTYFYYLIQLTLSFVSLRFLLFLNLKAPLRSSAEGNILLVIGFLLAASLL